MHAVAVRRTFKKKYQNSSGYIWKLKYRKHRCRCGTKQILKPKVSNYAECTPLWRQAQVEVNIYKKPSASDPFEIEIWKECRPVWREVQLNMKIIETLFEVFGEFVHRCSAKHI